MDDLSKFITSTTILQLPSNDFSSSSLAASSLVSSPTQNISHESNLQCAHNFWVKMAECDEQFVGPKRSKHTMVAYGNSLYVFGGDNGKQMLNDLICYDCNNNSWSKAPNLSPPTPRYHHTSVVSIFF